MALPKPWQRIERRYMPLAPPSVLGSTLLTTSTNAWPTNSVTIAR